MYDCIYSMAILWEDLYNLMQNNETGIKSIFMIPKMFSLSPNVS